MPVGKRYRDIQDRNMITGRTLKVVIFAHRPSPISHDWDMRNWKLSTTLERANVMVELSYFLKNSLRVHAAQAIKRCPLKTAKGNLEINKFYFRLHSIAESDAVKQNCPRITLQEV